jgi:RNA polymerase sigma-70 factor, ECF subfamily
MQDGDVPVATRSDIPQLLLRYQQGDTVAAAQLVRAVSPMLLRFCLSQGDHRDDVDDVLQEIWLRLHRARHTYRVGVSAEAWLYAIARHTRLDARRRRLRFQMREVQVEALPETAARSPIAKSTSPVSDLVAELPASQREVLMMLKGAGMTLEEVARATSSTVGAVKQKAHRAYQRLRASLDAVRREASE